MSILHEKSEVSSMRVALMWGMGLASLVFISISYKIAFKEEVDYSGLALIIGATAAFITGLAAGKVVQKGKEGKNV